LGTGSECGDDIQCSELLLPLRKPSSNHGNRRKIIIQFLTIRPRSTGWRAAGFTACPGLLFVNTPHCAPAYCTYSMTLPPVASTASRIYLSPVTYFPVCHRACHGSCCGMAVPFLRVTEEPHAQCYPFFADATSRVMTCLGFCVIYGAWTLITKNGRRLDAEIKRMQNASFHIPAMATSVCIMRGMQSERMRSYNMRTADGSHNSRSLEVQWGTKEIH